MRDKNDYTGFDIGVAITQVEFSVNKRVRPIQGIFGVETREKGYYRQRLADKVLVVTGMGRCVKGERGKKRK